VNSKGFTLIELMIVAALIAIIGSIAVPNLLSARKTANETSAIAVLKTVISAQTQVNSRRVIDVDGDGIGEYGYFAELTGTVPLRAAPAAPAVNLTPPLLSGSLGIVDPNGYVNKSGYYFLMHIADNNNQPWPEQPGGGDGGASAGWLGAGQGCDPSENYWNCYAWPVSVGGTANRVFMCNQSGDVIQSSNKTQGYTGTANPPPPLAAYANTGIDMRGKLSIRGNPAPANDGATWTVCN
jgi:prepilin-type N-terminal cleavage/methylation domain-containing protein